LEGATITKLRIARPPEDDHWTPATHCRNDEPLSLVLRSQDVDGIAAELGRPRYLGQQPTASRI